MSTEPIPMPERLAGRRAQMFPALTPAQLARVAAVAEEQRFQDGDVLFEPGQTETPMFVVLEGEVEIADITPHGPVRAIALHAGEFTGEVNLLRRGPALVRARACGATRVLRVDPTQFGALLQDDSELGNVLLRAFMLRRSALIEASVGSALVIGSEFSADTTRLRSFLRQNVQPYRYVDVDRDQEAERLLDAFHVDASDVPVLICHGERVLRNPTDAAAAECLGFNPSLEPHTLRDVVICGAGPAGLAAAVYAASEGMDVLVLEARSPGGQAAASSRIENYLGFPTGISGADLMIRALAQAEKFGAEVAVATSAVAIRDHEGTYEIDLSSGATVRSRTVVVATGASYRKLDVPDRERFEGVGLYYAATELEASRVGSDEVVVVGAANSAGQAATYLARASRRVHLLVRGGGLAAHMSRYLIRRIEATSNIELLTRTQVVSLEGNDHLERVAWRDDRSGSVTSHPIRHLFSMAGADPHTQWVSGLLATDAKGFILTGAELSEEDLAVAHWSKARRPLLFETNRPGIFAVGDVRASRIKRIASSVGEGSVCVQLVRQVLDE